MKTISILVPTYNEEKNIEPLYNAIKEEFEKNLPKYQYELVFIDNSSKDNTQNVIQKISKNDKYVKAIFNARNFGQFNSPYYGLMQTSGLATILLCADFQDPINMIHKFVKEWENGYKIVIGIKNKSKESKIKYLLRSIYYKAIKKYSDVEQIEHFTGFGLYDRLFINVLKELDDSEPYFRGIVSELGFERKEIPYTQEKRLHGKTSNNFYRLYDAAMLGITSYTKIGMRLATAFGFVLSIFSMIVAVIYLVLKLAFWNEFPAGTAPILIGVFFFGSVQLLFIGFLGEYIMNINSRVMKRPLVVEEKRINFDK